MSLILSVGLSSACGGLLEMPSGCPSRLLMGPLVASDCTGERAQGNRMSVRF